jgi:hypothetical protein
VAARREQKVTDLSTYIFPWYFITGGFPKRDEMEFLRDSIVRDLHDTRTFRYTYPAPFEARAVDVVIDVTVTDIKAANAHGWATFINLPFISLLQLVGVPSEFFTARMAFQFDVRTRDGDLIASYTATHGETDSVTLYELPWANYIWARSVFRKVFLACMDDFRAALLADGAMVRERAGAKP